MEPLLKSRASPQQVSCSEYRDIKHKFRECTLQPRQVTVDTCTVQAARRSQLSKFYLYIPDGGGHQAVAEEGRYLDGPH